MKKVNFLLNYRKSGKDVKLKLIGPKEEEELNQLSESYKNQKISL